MHDIPSLLALSNADLRSAITTSAASERAATAHLIALLAEYDRRRLYLEDGYASLFQFCVAGLHLSESAAYARIQAARASRKWPSILEALENGSATLTTIGLLAPHFTDDNCEALLAEARHQSKSVVERIVARLAPKPDVPSLVRKLPARAVVSTREAVTTTALTSPCSTASRAMPSQAEGALPAGLAVPEPSVVSVPSVLSTPSGLSRAIGVATLPSRAVVAPLAPERYKLQVTIDEETRDVLQQAQDLMRHTLPSGDPAAIVARALRVLVEDLLRKKVAATTRPRPSRDARDAHGARVGSRAIPAAVKRAVWMRDGGRCTFESARGRCDARGPLEYHHVIPYARGGAATVDNIELRCRAHNAYQAQLDGLGWVASAQDRCRDGSFSTGSGTS